MNRCFGETGDLDKAPNASVLEVLDILHEKINVVFGLCSSGRTDNTKTREGC